MRASNSKTPAEFIAPRMVVKKKLQYTQPQECSSQFRPVYISKSKKEISSQIANQKVK